MSETALSLDADDSKLVTLARAARARVGAADAAAVRDSDGRTYAAAAVRLTSLSLSGLALAVANAVSSGATTIEAAAVVAAADVLDRVTEDGGFAAVRELSVDAPIYVATPDGVAVGVAGGLQ